MANQKRKCETISLRIALAYLEKIRKIAAKYVDGNVYEGIRHAAVNIVPSENDVALDVVLGTK